MIKIDIPMPSCCGDCPCSECEIFVCNLTEADVEDYYDGEERHPDCPLEEENNEEK